MNLPAGFETDSVVRLETNLDDISPEIIGAVMERLFRAGALDVWNTPVQMKKNRPGVILTALCAEEHVPACSEILLTETSAFGIRIDTVTRLKLARRFETIETEFGPVIIKVGMRDDEIVQSAPEFESCRELAESVGRPLKEIYEAAVTAWRTKTRPYFPDQ